LNGNTGTTVACDLYTNLFSYSYSDLHEEGGDPSYGGYNDTLTYSSGSLNSTSLATVTSDLYTSLYSDSYSDLHEAGWQTGGVMALGCVLYDADGLSSYSQQQYQTQNSTQTLVVTGNQCLTMMGQPVGPGGVGTSTGVGYSTATTTGDGLYSYTDHEEGSYAAGSFALSCVVYQETAWADQTYTSYVSLTKMPSW